MKALVPLYNCNAISREKSITHREFPRDCFRVFHAFRVLIRFVIFSEAKRYARWRIEKQVLIAFDENWPPCRRVLGSVSLCINFLKHRAKQSEGRQGHRANGFFFAWPTKVETNPAALTVNLSQKIVEQEAND